MRDFAALSRADRFLFWIDAFSADRAGGAAPRTPRSCSCQDEGKAA
jgi:hypothetical protein